MTKLLTPRFFNRPALVVAKDLLGKFLVRRVGKRTISAMIVETEAYVGPQDKASHASRGRTPRTEIMFGKPGNFYIYFTYGMHWMLNVVTEREGYPAAVLIRAGITAAGKHINGPARLTKFLKIDKKLNGLPANKKSGLWFEDRGVKIKSSQIIAGKRIGVDYAGKWAKKHYNFRLRP
ncbi:MAG: DNA-3-methyladenine glycosylase [bacterium]|nr:DNA-3-methyladenine glycosylase [bacterium]